MQKSNDIYSNKVMIIKNDIKHIKRIQINLMGRANVGKSYFANSFLAIKDRKRFIFSVDSAPLTSYKTIFLPSSTHQQSVHFVFPLSYSDIFYNINFKQNYVHQLDTQKHPKRVQFAQGKNMNVAIKKVHNERREKLRNEKKNMGQLVKQKYMYVKGPGLIFKSEFVSKVGCIIDNQGTNDETYKEDNDNSGNQTDQQNKLEETNYQAINFQKNSQGLNILIFKLCNGCSNINVQKIITDSLLNNMENVIVIFNVFSYIEEQDVNNIQIKQAFYKAKYIEVVKLLKSIYQNQQIKVPAKQLEKISNYLKKTQNTYYSALTPSLISQFNQNYPFKFVYFLSCSQIIDQKFVFRLDWERQRFQKTVQHKVKNLYNIQLDKIENKIRLLQKQLKQINKKKGDQKGKLLKRIQQSKQYFSICHSQYLKSLEQNIKKALGQFQQVIKNYIQRLRKNLGRFEVKAQQIFNKMTFYSYMIAHKFRQKILEHLKDNNYQISIQTEFKQMIKFLIILFLETSQNFIQFIINSLAQLEVKVMLKSIWQKFNFKMDMNVMSRKREYTNEADNRFFKSLTDIRDHRFILQMQMQVFLIQNKAFYKQLSKVVSDSIQQKLQMSQRLQRKQVLQQYLMQLNKCKEQILYLKKQ